MAELSLRIRGATILVVKDGEVIFSTKVPGLRAVFEAAGHLKGELKDAAVADKVVGKAAALLYAYFQVSSVFGSLMSEGAAKVFRDRGIKFRFERLVPVILGKEGRGVCPFEGRVAGVSDPEDAFRILHGMFFRFFNTDQYGLRSGKIGQSRR